MIGSFMAHPGGDVLFHYRIRTALFSLNRDRVTEIFNLTVSIVLK